MYSMYDGGMPQTTCPAWYTEMPVPPEDANTLHTWEAAMNSKLDEASILQGAIKLQLPVLI